MIMVFSTVSRPGIGVHRLLVSATSVRSPRNLNHRMHDQVGTVVVRERGSVDNHIGIIARTGTLWSKAAFVVICGLEQLCPLENGSCILW